MKTLFIISNGKKPSDDASRWMEKEDLHFRVSLLEKQINTRLVDVQYLGTVPRREQIDNKVITSEGLRDLMTPTKKQEGKV